MITIEKLVVRFLQQNAVQVREQNAVQVREEQNDVQVREQKNAYPPTKLQWMRKWNDYKASLTTVLTNCISFALIFNQGVKRRAFFPP